MAGSIRIEGLRVGYEKDPVIDCLTVRIPMPGITTILGPNGSGKTTLLRALIKYIKPAAGAVYIDGRALQEVRISEIPEYFSYAPAELESGLALGVMDVMSNARSKGRWISEEKAEENMRFVGIHHLADKTMSDLSSGEKRLVLIARALASDASTMLLDEPTSNLDFGNKRRIMDMLSRLPERRISLLVATHDFDLAFRSGWTVALKNGSLFAAGKSKALLTGAFLSSLYGADIRLAKLNGRRAVLYE